MSFNRATSGGFTKAWSIRKPFRPFGEYQVYARVSPWRWRNPSHQPHAANVGSRPTSHVSDVQKLRAEIAHLELLIKKLQTELQIERQYNQALELHVRTLTQVE